MLYFYNVPLTVSFATDPLFIPIVSTFPLLMCVFKLLLVYETLSYLKRVEKYKIKQCFLSIC